MGSAKFPNQRKKSKGKKSLLILEIMGGGKSFIWVEEGKEKKMIRVGGGLLDFHKRRGRDLSPEERGGGGQKEEGGKKRTLPY